MQQVDFEHLKVSVEQDGRLVVVEIDHGKANEMGTAQLVEFERLRDWIRQSDRIVALITWSRRLSRRGNPIFIAGANVTERVGWHSDDVKAHVRRQRRILRDIRHLPVFHVVVVGGVALGWGTEYLLTADYRIASEGASFALPETGLGILPGAGGTSELWSHIGVPQALRLGMTGERIDAAEATRIGLVQEHVDSLETGLDRARALAARVCQRSPTAVGLFKRALLESVGQPEELRQEMEARAYEQCVDSGEAAIGREHFAQIRAGEAVPWGPRQSSK